MSQEKVERYKKEKAGRKKALARHKVFKTLGIVCCWVILIAIVGFAGYKGYDYWESKQPAKTITCNTSAVDDYLSEIAY